MKTGTSWREPACVVMHLNGGFTKVILERTVGVGLANGGIDVDIPTDCIPFHLRSIGSRFLVTMQSMQPEPLDSVDVVRSAMHDYSIEELP
jgi:hypothetical protein